MQTRQITIQVQKLSFDLHWPAVHSSMHNAYVSVCFALFCTINFRLISFISCDWLTFYVEIFWAASNIIYDFLHCQWQWNQYKWQPHINYDGSPNSLLHWPFLQFMYKINKQFANETQWIKKKIETNLKSKQTHSYNLMIRILPSQSLVSLFASMPSFHFIWRKIWKTESIEQKMKQFSSRHSKQNENDEHEYFTQSHLRSVETSRLWK